MNGRCVQGLSTRLILSGASAFLLLVGAGACNLVRTAPGTPAALVAAPTAFSLPVPTTNGLAVRIASPASGTTLPSGKPVDVVFSASGGPFIEFDLMVDGSIVSSQVVTAMDAQMNGSLAWPAPADGQHTLTIRVLDANKNIAQADQPVQVGAAGMTSASPTAGAATSGGFQIRFTNFTDRGTLDATLDSQGKPQVVLHFEVTGLVPFIVTMTANGINIPGEARNPNGSLPFDGQIQWSPLNGGGTYTLVAYATSADKQSAQATATVTVTGVAAFTPTPPPLDRSAAQLRFSELFKQLDGITIPAPSLQRFDFPQSPEYSRWISSIYYKGQRYYIELYDDTHYVAEPTLPYSDPAHRINNSSFTLCRPAGNYKILVVYVDYGNLTVDKADALTQVPIFATWTDQLYNDFARSQGFSASPLSIQADGAWIATPPSPGALLTRAQILAGTGIDASKYDFVIQIDLDQNNTTGLKHWPGLLDQGGGVALQGCGAYDKSGEVNIWSVVMQTRGTKDFVHGTLSMDFNHELSHLFGMLDNWPFSPGSITSPDGARHDDWIPYVNFGWTDTDGDGIPEIVDPTPYGTLGPQP
jgi:hypothetical protein